MRTEFFLLLVAFVLVAGSCDRRVDSADSETIGIPVQLKGPGRVTGISLYDIVEHPQTIVVDPPQPMTQIYQLKYVRGRYYMTDSRRRNILVFDDDGRILLNLSRRGRAEYEYVSMECFDVNPANGEISIYDIDRRRMVVYSEDGQYARSFDLAKGVRVFQDFAVREDGSYLIYVSHGTPGSSNPRGLIELDRNGNLSRVMASLDDDFQLILNYMPYVNFHRLSDGTLTVHGQQDKNEIYHIDRAGVLSIPYQIAYDVTWSEAMRKMTEPFEEPDYYDIVQYFETDHWLGMFVRYQEKHSVLVYYNKETGECYTGKTEKGKITFQDVLPYEKGDLPYYQFSAGDRLMFPDNPSAYKEDAADNKIYVKVYMEKGLPE